MRSCCYGSLPCPCPPRVLCRCVRPPSRATAPAPAFRRVRSGAPPASPPAAASSSAAAAELMRPVQSRTTCVGGVVQAVFARHLRYGLASRQRFAWWAICSCASRDIALRVAETAAAGLAGHYHAGDILTIYTCFDDYVRAATGVESGFSSFVLWGYFRDKWSCIVQGCRVKAGVLPGYGIPRVSVATPRIISRSVKVASRT